VIGRAPHHQNDRDRNRHARSHNKRYASRILRRFFFQIRMFRKWYRRIFPRDRVTALFTVILGISTTFLVIAAFFQHRDTQDVIEATNRQYGAMTKQLKEMKIANKTNRDALTSVQRAFVSIPTPIIAEAPDPHNPGQTLYQIMIRWENTGNTPTRNLTMRFRFIPSPTAIDDPWDFNSPKTVTIPREFISPKDKVSEGSYYMSHQEAVDTVQRRSYLYAIAEATYDDILKSGEPHITQFCASYKGVAGVVIQNLQVVHWESCRHHNCADDECGNP
jgi:hypothetical protein